MSKPLTFALVSPDYPPDPKGTGIGTYTKLLANYLVERGHQVHVISRTSKTKQVTSYNETPKQGLTVHRIGIPRPDIPLDISPLKVLSLTLLSLKSELRYRRKLAAKLNQLIRDEKVQIIEAAEAFSESIFYQPRRWPAIPFIVKLHTPLAVGELFDKNLPEPARRLVRFFERRFILKASHVSIPSSEGKALFRKEMKLGNLAITSIPNPPPKFEKGPDTNESLTPTVLFVGRVTRFKGVEVLIRAIPKILASLPKTQFVFIGADSTQGGPYPSTIAGLKAKLSTEHIKQVRFLGHLDHSNLMQYYETAHVCVFPSLFEIFGYTCLEAMSYGKAIVGSAHGGMADLLDHGRCGLLYTPPDENELAQHILELLNNKDLRENLGQLAKERAMMHFSAERVLDIHETFYQKALDDCA